jgi:hypothetical protein
MNISISKPTAPVVQVIKAAKVSPLISIAKSV